MHGKTLKSPDGLDIHLGGNHTIREWPAQSNTCPMPEGETSWLHKKVEKALVWQVVSCSPIVGPCSEWRHGHRVKRGFRGEVNSNKKEGETNDQSHYCSVFLRIVKDIRMAGVVSPSIFQPGGNDWCAR